MGWAKQTKQFQYLKKQVLSNDPGFLPGSLVTLCVYQPIYCDVFIVSVKHPELEDDSCDMLPEVGGWERVFSSENEALEFYHNTHTIEEGFNDSNWSRI